MRLLLSVLCLSRLFLLFVDRVGAFTVMIAGRCGSSSTAGATRGAAQLRCAATQQRQLEPQAFAAGYSTDADLLRALEGAVDGAVSGLPSDCGRVDLCIVYVSSLYDGTAAQPALVTVPALLAAARGRGVDVRSVVGCSAAGCIGSLVAAEAPPPPPSSHKKKRRKEEERRNAAAAAAACRPVEHESVPAVSVTLAVMPGVSVRTFHVVPADLPDADDDGGRRAHPSRWKRAVGLAGVGEEEEGGEEADADDDVEEEEEEEGSSSTSPSEPPVFFVLPSPGFSTELDNLLQGLQLYFPGCQTIGGIASTVSSLSRAKLFRWQPGVQDVCLTEGCVGVALTGDVAVRSLTALGAKPVGGIYRIVKAIDSTVNVICLDETATEALQEEEEAEEIQEEEDEEEEEEEEEPTTDNVKAKLTQFYAKARIPKPPLAEANFLMRTLSDDDQAFMRQKLLIGLERGGALGRTASELARLASGRGHRFTVHQVASAGMKDGSVTLPLGSVQVATGQRMRFFVREPDFARREVEALWTGYKKRQLDEQFARDDSTEKKKKPAFVPGACFIIPTLDRGSKFFQGKPGYESSTASKALPAVPCISGFFSNGIVGRMDGREDAKTGIQGSASGYFLVGSKSGRPVYSALQAAAAKRAAEEERAAKEAEAQQQAVDDERHEARTKSVAELDKRAPRSDDGELILKRREVHSGRALTVSTVEWSVAEKMAKPSSALEGFMWDKETEVDRFRERVPLANLVSQCRLSMKDPTSPKPRDWVGPIKEAAAKGDFVIVPECKRMDPVGGSLRRRYDLPKLIREFTLAGVPAISVNCDSVLFGGSLEHISTARKESSKAAVERMSEDGVVVPPILASDLVLYPYQLYKLRLAGADAVNLVAGALASKDLMYLTKIASSIQIQTLVTVTSEVQLKRLAALKAGSVDGVIVSNRELEDFSFDETGEQALSLLKSEALQKFKEKHGDILVLAEGRVGVIERPDEQGNMSANQYLKELKEAGALGAVVGGGLAASGVDIGQILEVLSC
jgi:indole-3-glycerol phosphate synthase